MGQVLKPEVVPRFWRFCLAGLEDGPAAVSSNSRPGLKPSPRVVGGQFLGMTSGRQPCINIRVLISSGRPAARPLLEFGVAKSSNNSTAPNRFSSPDLRQTKNRRLVLTGTRPMHQVPRANELTRLLPSSCARKKRPWRIVAGLKDASKKKSKKDAGAYAPTGPLDGGTGPRRDEHLALRRRPESRGTPRNRRDPTGSRH